MTDDPPLAARHASFEALVLPCVPLLRQQAGHLVAVDHADLVQETLCHAWRGWPPESTADIHAWLTVIQRNIAVSLHRPLQARHDREAAWHAVYYGEMMSPRLALTTAQCLATPQLWLSDALLPHWCRLPRAWQELLFHHAVAGDWTLDEAAQHQGIPRGTVGTRLARAKRALRQDWRPVAYVA